MGALTLAPQLSSAPKGKIAGKKVQVDEREKELAVVKINPVDVEIIASELELDKKIAERALCEHKGDVVAAKIKNENTILDGTDITL
ncbi:DNA-binding enhancer protein-related [Zea mays]|uniref:DNA-binding enhancer protein-related n=1 Tax=Zea mays TaxID=4577 RepID=A0A1D6MC00_MAIZE|nr:DNA-binding enhancer protein-related [Zea mays]